MFLLIGDKSAVTIVAGELKEKKMKEVEKKKGQIKKEKLHVIKK